MKTLTYILYFVAIFGLIEANWRVIDHSGFSSREKSNFKTYVRSAVSQGGSNADKMDFLRIKMEQEHRVNGEWSCFYGHFWGSFRTHKSITVAKGRGPKSTMVLCFLVQY